MTIGYQQTQQHTGQNTKKSSSVGKAIFSIDNKWEHIAKLLKKQVGETEYRNWIAPLSVCSVQKKVVEIAAPTRFIRDWVSMHYTDKIKRIWDAAYPHDILGLDIIAAPELKTLKKAANSSAITETTNHSSNAKPYAKEDNQEHGQEHITKTIKASANNPIECSLDPRFTFDSFVGDKSNELAIAAAKRIVESDVVSFNPLFLYSGVGLGKTHLMHAVGWAIKERSPERKVLYMSAEKFMYEFIRSLQSKSTMSFKEMFRSVDLLMIDDVQFISGKNKIQEEFFHTFNALVDQNRQIIISADRPPSDIEGLGERLRSRLGWGLVADIHPATYDLRLKILKSKIQYIPNINIAENVLEFLAEKITSNVRELEGALNRIVMQTELTGQDINLGEVKIILQDLLKANDRIVTIEDIQNTVATYYDIRVQDIHSARRAQVITRPRHVAMYLSKILTAASLPSIGQKFGGRDHTTVLYAVRKIEESLSKDSQLAKDISTLKENLKQN